MSKTPEENSAWKSSRQSVWIVDPPPSGAPPTLDELRLVITRRRTRRRRWTGVMVAGVVAGLWFGPHRSSSRRTELQNAPTVFETIAADQLTSEPTPDIALTVVQHQPIFRLLDADQQTYQLVGWSQELHTQAASFEQLPESLRRSALDALTVHEQPSL